MARTHKRRSQGGCDKPYKLRKITAAPNVHRITRQQDFDASRKAALLASEPARRAVLETPELLENVLEFLTEREMIQATRVCKLFNNAVHNSQKLRRRLFIDADPRADPANPVRNNIIFVENGVYERDFSFLAKNSRIVASGVKDELVWRKHLSCNNMFLTQPPAKEVCISVWIRRQHKGSPTRPFLGSPRRVRLRRDCGIKLGDLRQFFENFAQMLNATTVGNTYRDFISTQTCLYTYNNGSDDFRPFEDEFEALYPRLTRREGLRPLR